MNYQFTFSPTGGTKKVADIISKVLFDEYISVEFCCPKENQITPELHKEDVCLIAVPSFAGRVPAPSVEYLNTLEGNGAKAVLLCVYGNRAYEDTLVELQNILNNKGFDVVAAMTGIAEHSIMHQYAKGRPDAQDNEKLKEIAARIKEKMEEQRVSSCKVPGNYPYRVVEKMPIQPKANERCNGCGLCVKNCPVGAIIAESLKTCDAEKCINCMKCVAICTANAREINPSLIKLSAFKMRKAFAERKEPELYL